MLIVITILIFVAAGYLTNGRDGGTFENVQVKPSLESRSPEGALYTSSTQSILRQSHWLETVTQVDAKVSGFDAHIILKSPDRKHWLELKNIPFEELVPRLHYTPPSSPDEFDAYNLMMAEYARNSVSVPQGDRKTTMAHFRSNLVESSPWELEEDFVFKPNPSYRPIRFGVINNCLAPGLWELNAVDRAAEIYHAWFNMPLEFYYDLVARANHLPFSFVEEAMDWKTENVRMALERLREKTHGLGTYPVTILESSTGFSSQDSRRKLAKGFVKIKQDEKLTIPSSLEEFKTNSVFMSDFVPPGKYSFDKRKEFDVRFLFSAENVEVSLVTPLTNYAKNEDNAATFKETEYLEMKIKLGNHRYIIVGNLPLSLLVQQEDYVIYGFGVGVLSSSEPAERRKLLVAEGPRPSYAYLAEENEGSLYAVNSHEAGIEQVFIRCLPSDRKPHFLVTITSFERITDLVKYKIPIPPTLLEKARNYSRQYISPIFYNYRDNNLR